MKNSQASPNKKIKLPSPKSAAIKKRLIFVAVLAIMALFAFKFYEFGRLNRWWGDSDEVRILRKESIAAKDLLGMKLIYFEETKPEHQTFKSEPPYLRRWFSVPDNEDIIDAKHNVINFALQEGWMERDFNHKINEWYGSKYSKNGQLLYLYIKAQHPDTDDYPYYGYIHDDPLIIVGLSS